MAQSRQSLDTSAHGGLSVYFRVEVLGARGMKRPRPEFIWSEWGNSRTTNRSLQLINIFPNRAKSPMSYTATFGAFTTRNEQLVPEVINEPRSDDRRKLQALDRDSGLKSSEFIVWF
jgi:hypothetical protein